MRCPYVNVHETCEVGQPIEQLPMVPKYLHCYHVDGIYCTDYRKYGGCQEEPKK